MKNFFFKMALSAGLCMACIACEEAPAPSADEVYAAPPATSPTTKIEETFYENGVLKTRGTLVNGQRQGMWTSYYPNGFLWSEGEYNNGLRDGSVVTYFENGKIRYSGTFTNDERTGLWSFYDSTGTVIKQVDYTKNQ